MAKANWPTHYIAMTTVTGPSEAWFLTGYPSFAAWEKDRERHRQERRAHRGPRPARSRRTASSCRTGGASSPCTARRPERGQPRRRSRRCGTSASSRSGCAPDTRTTSGRRQDREGRVREGEGRPALGGLPDLGRDARPDVHDFPSDEVDVRDRRRDRARRRRSGRPRAPRTRRLSRSCRPTATRRSRANVFAFSPAMSYPSKEFVARDPEFWTPKAEAKPAAPAKKAGAGRRGTPSRPPRSRTLSARRRDIVIHARRVFPGARRRPRGR